jgi:hypothetical protein
VINNITLKVRQRFTKMIKYQEIKLRTKDDLRKVPNPFIGLLTEKHIGKTVLSFKTRREDVTISSELLRILKKVNANVEDLLILTNCLTEESLIILNVRKIEFLIKTNFYWTDESYINIR